MVSGFLALVCRIVLDVVTLPMRQIPVDGGWHPHKTNSRETDYQSSLKAALAQHGGANPFNPMGSMPMNMDDQKLALGIQGKSYLANLNNPVQRGEELYG